MITYFLVLILNGEPMDIAFTDSAETCRLWAGYAEANECRMETVL